MSEGRTQEGPTARGVAERAAELYAQELRRVHAERDRVFGKLLCVQWLAALAIAHFWSPSAWEGKVRTAHLYVPSALVLGALFTLPPLVVTRLYPGAAVTRHVVAVAQLLFSALFIHLTAGRSETHFHVFGSLAFLAFYRDWRILGTATIVVTADCLVRGMLWPESIYGVTNPEWWRSLEHAFWVLFESSGLVAAIAESHAQMRGIARRQAELEATNASIEETVARRTFELETSREQFRALVETTQAVPWELDTLELRFRYVGPQVEEIFGIPAADFLLPGFLEQRLHPEDRRKAIAALELVAKRGSGEIEARVRRPDGRYLWLRFIASSAGVPAAEDARDTLTPVILGMMFDTSNARRLELELAQAQKLESVGRLAAGVAHEINTPVQFVSDSVHFVRDAVGDFVTLTEKYRVLCAAALEGKLVGEAAALVQQAEDDADLPYLIEQVPRALARSLEGLERVATIVRSMKEFAHPDEKEMAAADLNQAIQSTLVIAHNEYKYVAELELELGDIPPVRCHVGDLNQAVLNVLVNGAHAIADVVKDTGGRGRLTVRTRRDGPSVIVEIGDTGGGIPAAIQAQVFDPFFTTKEVGRGSGQGLAIARAIVCDKHGGELGFDTSPAGTTFRIVLPIAGRPARAEAA
ncbi:MAG TPA: ATP-binding protein [Polyangiaceae bacterium]|nr:ATP-binding protein [Polyangiaceae bacterium]